MDWTDDKDHIYVYVTDSGSGIPIKYRGRIFDPFFTTKGHEQRSGIGLSSAVKIAAHQNGAIRLDTLNAHTRFCVQLPKKQPTAMK